MTRGLRYASMDVLPEKMRVRIAEQTRRPAPCAPSAAARNKYHNTPVTVDGIRFDSTKEARYYEWLKLRQAAGDVRYFLRQVAIHLPGGTRYVVDFQLHMSDGSVHYVDVKGRQTQLFRVKKREVEHHYPIIIELA